MVTMMKSCIIPGSFDPVTKGHISLFESAARVFDKVYVVILVNSEKKGGMFTYDERLIILKNAVEALIDKGISNIEAVMYSGLTTDAAKCLGAQFIVKGVRNITDFAYEYDLSEISRRFEPSLETVFLPSKAEFSCVSSTYVRELIKYGRFDSGDFADGTAELIAELYKNKQA